jgi:hypothetical protein
MILNKDQLIQKLKLKTKVVKIGDDEVIISELGANDFIELYKRKDLKTEKDDLDITKFNAALVCLAVVDENGNKVLTDADISVLQNGGEIYRNLLNEVKSFCGLNGDEIKNSESSPD